MRKHIALGTVLALGLGGQAFAAEGFSYNNVDVMFAHGKYTLNGYEDELGIDGAKGDGFSLAGSVEFGENLFGFASFGSLKLDKLKLDGNTVDADGAELKVKPLTVGVGFHWPINPSLDFVSGASFERQKVSLSAPDFFASDSANGYGLNAGLRGRVGDSLELTGNLKYIDVEGSDFIYNVGGRYYFTDAFAGGIDYTKYDDSNLSILGVTLRYDFGPR